MPILARRRARTLAALTRLGRSAELASSMSSAGRRQLRSALRLPPQSTRADAQQLPPLRTLRPRAVPRFRPTLQARGRRGERRAGRFSRDDCRGDCRQVSSKLSGFRECWPCAKSSPKLFRNTFFRPMVVIAAMRVHSAIPNDDRGGDWPLAGRPAAVDWGPTGCPRRSVCGGGDLALVREGVCYLVRVSARSSQSPQALPRPWRIRDRTLACAGRVLPRSAA